MSRRLRSGVLLDNEETVFKRHIIFNAKIVFQVNTESFKINIIHFF